jgi:hypothetical protein
MLCDECKEKPVTVFITQIVNGEETEWKLCTGCAEPFTKGLPSASAASGQGEIALDPRMLEPPADGPSEVTISDPITVLELSRALHAQFYEVVAVLIQHGIFKSADDALDFSTASLVCTHYGVTPHRAS